MCALLAFTLSCSSNDDNDQISPKALQILSLTNKNTKLEVTPQLGGRPISYALNNTTNVLKVGKAVWTHPEPGFNEPINPFSYSGHVVWFGPQSGWWKHQTIDLERQARGAAWPPDPYTTRNVMEVVAHSATQIILRGETSPVNGLRVTKEFTAIDDQWGSIMHTVNAQNMREKDILEWDIWFNTRVPIKAQIFLPVSNRSNVRSQVAAEDGELEFLIKDGVMHFSATKPSNNRPQTKGKLFIDPSEPWLAAYHDQQLFVIRFKDIPQDQIHHEHALVELYINRDSRNIVNDGFELEVHSELNRLAPGDTMSAHQTWSILPYLGSPTAKAIQQFIQDSLL